MYLCILSVTLPAVLQTMVPSLIISWGETLSINLMSAGSANADMESQKLEAIFCEPCSHYGSASVPPSEAISEDLIFKKFPVGACPPDPPSNPPAPSENPGYRPPCTVLSTWKKSECDSGSLVKLSLRIPKRTDGLFLLGPVWLRAATVMLETHVVTLLSM